MAQQQIPAQAPDFTLEHVLGHEVSLADYRGRNVVAMFGGKESAEQIQQSVEAIRARFSPDELPVLAVSDLQGVPRPARIIAKGQMKKAFEGAVKDQVARLEAAGKPVPDDDTRGVMMLMDWKGDAIKGFGLSDVDSEAVGVLIDGEGRVVSSAAGAQAGEQLLAALSEQ